MTFVSNFAEGFLAMSIVIWTLNIITVVTSGHTWMGLAYLFVLLVPVSMILRTRLRRRKNDVVDGFTGMLISLYGVCFGCWVFDIVTTYYAINILGGAEELNPLGFPFGIFGALVFYAPETVFIYTLARALNPRFFFAWCSFNSQLTF